MKKIIFALFIVLTVLAGYFLYPQTASDSEPPRVIAFGDSLTYGRGSEAGGGYVQMLSDDLGVPIDNLGLTGDTTEGALKRIAQVTGRKPTITIVLLGGNDFLMGVPQEKTFGNLGKIIEIIQASGAEVLLIGLEPVIGKRGERAAFDALAKKYKTAYVPNILRGIYGRLDMMSDNLHPNDKGYKLMADRIEPVLEELVD